MPQLSPSAGLIIFLTITMLFLFLTISNNTLKGNGISANLKR